jgi:hypothetical protein
LPSTFTGCLQNNTTNSSTHELLSSAHAYCLHDTYEYCIDRQKQL